MQTRIWDAWAQGLSISRISRSLPSGDLNVRNLIYAKGGIRPEPRRRAQRALSPREGELIGQGLAAGCSLRTIAGHRKRAPSTISREVKRNHGVRYRGLAADARAWRQARRLKKCLLSEQGALRDLVVEKLLLDWSPQQISGWLRKMYPHDPTMHVSHETIYRSLFVHARGVLKQELRAHLRRGQSLRIPRTARDPALRTRIADAISIRERPAEAQDRAVPGALGGGSDLWFRLDSSRDARRT